MGFKRPEFKPIFLIYYLDNNFWILFCFSWEKAAISVRLRQVVSFNRKKIKKLFIYYIFLFIFITNRSTNTTLQYKSPTLITIFTLLISIICFLFISYCICILFCYYLKCGLFKVPTVVVINAVSRSRRRRYQHSHRESDNTSTEIIQQQTQPKSTIETTSSRTSGSSSASLSSSSSTYSITQHRSNIQSKLKSNRKSLQHNEPKTPSDQHASSHMHKRNSRTRDGLLSKSVDNYQNKNKSSSSSRVSNTNETSSRRTRAPPRRQRSLYAEPECYIDYDNDSPFLIPPNKSTSHNRSNINTNNGAGSSRSKTYASSNKRRSSRSANTSGVASVSNSARIQSNRSSSSIQRSRTSSTDHSYGTAVALIDIDSMGQSRAGTQLETVRGSSSESSLSRMSSIGAGVNSVGAGSGLSTAHVHVTQEQALLELITNTENEITASTLLLSSGVTGLAPSYYEDEKPPSYDDIIRQNN